MPRDHWSEVIREQQHIGLFHQFDGDVMHLESANGGDEGGCVVFGLCLK